MAMAIDEKTAGFLYSVGIGLIVALICLLILSCLRPKYPQVFQRRRMLNRWKALNDFNGTRVGVPELLPRPGLLGWLGPTLATEEDDIVRKIGLDAAMFIRYLKTSVFIMALLSAAGICILFPVYGTAGNKSLPSSEIDFAEGMAVVSLANVPERNWRLWLTLLMETFSAIVITYFMSRDYKRYSTLRRLYRVAENPVNYALIVFDIPKDMCNEAAIRDRFELMVPGQVAEVVVVRDGSKAAKYQGLLDKAVAKRERAEYVRNQTEGGVGPSHRPGACGAMMCWKSKVDSVSHWTAEQAQQEAAIIEEGENAAICTSAIVVFSNKRAASLLSQANMATDASEWTVVRAPEPEGVHWPAFKIPGYQAVWRKLAVFVYFLLLTAFWIIPAAFICGLFELNELSKKAAFEWIAPLFDISPALTGIVSGLLPPIVMSVIIGLIPAFIRLAVKQERIASLPEIERKTRDYFYGFTIYGSFFAVVLGSSILKDLSAITDEPKSILDALASGIPTFGIFFASFIIIVTFIPLSLMLCGIVRIIVRTIFMKMAKTERERRKAELGGSLFPYFKFSGQAMLIFFIGAVYSSLAPVVTVCATIFFGYAYAVYKHEVLYTAYAPWDGGGNMYPGAYWGTMLGLVLRQLVVIFVLGLKKGAAQSVLAVIPLLFTIAAMLGTNRRYDRVSKHGSIHDQFSESAKLEEIPVQYNGIYEPPAGKRTIYENLNGIADIKDMYTEEGYGTENDVESEYVNTDTGYVPDRAAERADFPA